MFERIRVLIVDDQQRTRQSLRALLATWPRVEEVQEAANGRLAIGLVERLEPDVVLMDVRMPEMDGLEATQLIKTRWPQVKIIMLSMYTEYIESALDAGADAFVSKGEPPERLLSIVATIAARGNKGF
jgi:DNA-binding NarL/FixJ family response regulator